MKSVSSNPFYKKKFFLDIIGCPPEVEKNLLNDLKWLGAREAFHCKDATFVVSNKSMQCKPWVPTTLNSPCHSPQMLSDYSMDLGSPEYTNSQVIDRKAVPLSQSRGKVLLQKSQQIVKKHGTTDTLAVCKQYGVKVYHIDKVQSYLKKIKNLYGTKKVSSNQERSMVTNVQSKFSSPNNDVQKIRAPFVKIEDVNRQYRTRHRVFSSWADIIDPTLSQSVKELHKNFVINGSIEHQTLFRPILRDISINKMNSQFLMPLTPTKSFTKQSPAASMISSTDTRKKPEVPVQCADKKKNHRRKKKQYCEICSVHFSNLHEHIESKSHLKFMNDATNYSKLEQLIEKLPKFADIMKLNLTGCNNYESGFLPNGCNHLGDTNFAAQQATPSKEMNLFSSESSEFATELYDLDDDSIISATCSTASSGLFFLQDRLDLDVSPEIPISCSKVNNNQFIPDCSNTLENLQIPTKNNDFENDSKLCEFTSSYLELKNTSILKETECRVADLQTDVSLLEIYDTSIVSLPINEEKDVSTEKTDLKELMYSMSESFENSLFSNPRRAKSKKRKRGEDLETYMLKKFLRDELSMHISDPNVSNEGFHDSGFCSTMNFDQNLSQHAESSLYASVHGNSTDSNQAVDLSILDKSASNLEVSIPISVPESSSSLSPPILDLCKQVPPISTYSSPPVLSNELSDTEILNQNNLPQVKNLTDSIHSNVTKVNRRDILTGCAIENTILKASRVEDCISLNCCETTHETQIVCDSTLKLSQTGVLEVKDTLVIASETKDKSTCLKSLFLYKSKSNLMLEKRLLYRDSFLYCHGSSESFLERWLAVSSQTYSSYYLGKFAEVLISQNKQQLSGNIILRLNKVLKGDGVRKVFIVLNACGKNITYKFIKQQLAELSLLYHPSVSKHLRHIGYSLENKFRLWQKYSAMSSFISDWGASHQTYLNSTECKLCLMSDIFIPCDNPICLKKSLIKINLVSEKIGDISVHSTAVDLSLSQSYPCDVALPPDLPGDIPSDRSSFGTLCSRDCTEIGSSLSEEEYIIVDSYSDEMDWVKMNPYSEEF